MISSLLIANRGEIACRIIETCRKLGIRTVAVYSDADARARHVRMADVAVHIGPAPAVDSYLRGEVIVEAAKTHGADAVHPGYGFLSENADFAEAVIAAGLIWVGPKPETIRAMGLKDEAKRLAEEAGVPVLPGYRGEAQDAKTLAAAAKEVGFPLLIKAIAGGGGRGIREVEKASAFKTQLESAVREAEAAFGDGRVLLEKLVKTPRHIEVQVFGDSKGNTVHMFERDCSFQRRRQKVIEEAPAPGMAETVRKAMTGAAVALAKSVGYESAGTVEFIVDGDAPLTKDNFFFLEMNTRLQVEHPVSEMITGLDFVELQLRVASGDALPVTQSDITLTGHAIEARICAEDPAEGFRPGAGLIEVFGPMAEMEGERLRWETGFEAGDRVPPTYDSMIAKLVVWGETREVAIADLVSVLDHTQLVGVPGNIGFLGRCARSKMFADGSHHVNAIGQANDELTTPPGNHELASVLAVCDIQLEDLGGADPWSRKDGWRLNTAKRQMAPVAVGADSDVLDPDAFSLEDDTPIPFVTALSERRFAVTTGGDTSLVVIPDFDEVAEALGGGDSVLAPMPGKIIALLVEIGDEIAKDAPVAVLEAMKMEHTLVAPRAGTISEISASLGDQVSEGTKIARFNVD
jgi:acetyl/propionyl-CoA carboxylase alpha subunit